MIGTFIEPHVHTFVRHDDGKDYSVGRTCGTGPTVGGLGSKEMKGVTGYRETSHN
jgi:hypothetical protein